MSSEKKPEKTPLTIAEVKHLTYQMWGKDQTGLNRDQKRLFEYLAKFVKAEGAEACRAAVKELVNELQISKEDAVVLVNILPENKEELRPMLFRSYPLLDAKAYSRIVEIMDDLRKRSGAGEG